MKSLFNGVGITGMFIFILLRSFFPEDKEKIKKLQKEIDKYTKLIKEELNYLNRKNDDSIYT